MHTSQTGIFSFRGEHEKRGKIIADDFRLVWLSASESLDTLKIYAAQVNYSNLIGTGKRCDKPKTAAFVKAGASQIEFVERQESE